MLKTNAEIKNFFLRNPIPLFYVSTSTYNILGADDWIANLTFINSVDSFDGRHPRIFTATPPPDSIAPGIEPANNYLLSHPKVAEHIRSRQPDAGVLFLMFDEQTEQLARSLNLTVALPPAKMRAELDSKVTTTRLAAQAGIPQVPNILAQIDSYRTLRELAGHLGPDLVVQLPWGDSGVTTFFISCESDYLPHAAKIAAEPEVKIMKRIRCRQFTIEGCVTRHGTLAGPLMTELVGFPELTPFSGGWCGNEVFGSADSALVTHEMRREAQRAVIAMGDQLRRQGYWGVFGLDFLLDQDSAALYLGEMNPRITGVTPLTSQAARDRNQPPLLLFHLLEWMKTDYTLDTEEFNQRWLEPGPAAPWSQLIMEYTRDEPGTLSARLPKSGVWTFDTSGSATYLRDAFRFSDASSDGEAFFMRVMDAGHIAFRGSCLGRLNLRGRLIGDDYRFTPRAAAWVQAFYRLFDSATE